MKNKNVENLDAVHTHTHTLIFYKKIRNMVSLCDRISFINHKNNLIKENTKIDYYMMRKYKDEKNLDSLSFL